MGRRSDHSRDELAALIMDEAHRQLADAGFRSFSARSVAKAIGYSVGTILNVFGSVDALIVKLNTRTFSLWADHVRSRLDRAHGDRVGAMVEAYYSFAMENRQLWMAIYDHRLPPGMSLAPEEAAQRFALTDLVMDEVASFLESPRTPEIEQLTLSLIATVHGHCSLEINGSYAALKGVDSLVRAAERVREALKSFPSALRGADG